MADAFKDIVESRDIILKELSVAAARVRQELAQTTKIGSYLDLLAKRQNDLLAEMAAVRAAATDEVLNLPIVKKARQQIVLLSEEMTRRASELRTAKDILVKVGAVLAVGQSFADTVASLRRKA